MTGAAGMSSEEITAWWIAVIAGFVVVLAVAALLSLLVWFVKIIERRVAGIRDTLQAITGNTASTTLIPQTGDAVDRVLAEGLAHHLFLGRVPLDRSAAVTNGGGR
ncbi:MULTISPECIES: hypothetical protein [Pseudonocardia]|uniref:Uncharacterized protein n=2 Tax=Pseudonocardia TaxID=1847 RepID=A0A1Y2N4G1_PSEAH|nr:MULTISPECIES: hypothetical protein [Pseudonocardia]OSY42061.1 hypothetical protein BG845_01557 [Pseudonocardia autotrophica]TDN75170.1 hypothetical protein C8E95_4314 [Pseudonocardia autotrophica]BBF99115.1 hypothetical protein Pdca_03250 [Pseudonocardia autotrophica]GEC24035.1 hypothetical protein PSA01_10640 [Pseudonocardia saturnea]